MIKYQSTTIHQIDTEDLEKEIYTNLGIRYDVADAIFHHYSVNYTFNINSVNKPDLNDIKDNSDYPYILEEILNALCYLGAVPEGNINIWCEF